VCADRRSRSTRQWTNSSAWQEPIETFYHRCGDDAPDEGGARLVDWRMQATVRGWHLAGCCCLALVPWRPSSPDGLAALIAIADQDPPPSAFVVRYALFSIGLLLPVVLLVVSWWWLGREKSRRVA
jgi:hypothetical protein